MTLNDFQEQLDWCMIESCKYSLQHCLLQNSAIQQAKSQTFSHSITHFSFRLFSNKKFCQSLVPDQTLNFVKVHIFLEGHKILQNLHRIFDRYYIEQIYGGDFSRFCGLLRMYELKKHIPNLAPSSLESWYITSLGLALAFSHCFCFLFTEGPEEYTL